MQGYSKFGKIHVVLLPVLNNDFGFVYIAI